MRTSVYNDVKKEEGEEKNEEGEETFCIFVKMLEMVPYYFFKVQVTLQCCWVCAVLSTMSPAPLQHCVVFEQGRNVITAARADLGSDAA